MRLSFQLWGILWNILWAILRGILGGILGAYFWDTMCQWRQKYQITTIITQCQNHSAHNIFNKKNNPESNEYALHFCFKYNGRQHFLNIATIQQIFNQKKHRKCR